MTRTPFQLVPAVFLAATLAVAGCSKEETGAPPGSAADYRQAALAFTRSLAARDYPKAHAMTTLAYRARRSQAQLQTDFEAIVPADWGPIGPIEIGDARADWRGRQPADLAWVYVSIGGEVYSEAVIVVVALENGAAKIREIEFGRP